MTLWKRKQNRIVAYTAISGDKDDLIEPRKKPRGCDLYAFTESDNQSKNYRTFSVISEFDEPVMRAKRYKILPHHFFAGHEISVWLDGNLEMIGDIEALVERYLQGVNMAVFKHPDGRGCVYEEAEACIEMKKDDPERIRKQVEGYRTMKYPEKNGLVACSVLIRRHKAYDCILAMERWWREIVEGSYRDQLSFPVVAWQTDLKYNVIDEDFRDCAWFRWRPHKKT